MRRLSRLFSMSAIGWRYRTSWEQSPSSGERESGSAFARVKLLCAGCYQVAKALNGFAENE